MEANNNAADATTEKEYEYVRQYVDDDDIARDAEREGYDFNNPDERADAIRTSARLTIDSGIDHLVNQGHSHADATIRILPEIPESLVAETLQTARDVLANDGSFEDLEEELAIEQTAEEYGEDTSETRRDVWDRLLKFSEYEVEIRYQIEGEYGTRNRFYHRIAESSADAQNSALREYRANEPDAEFAGARTTVLRRMFPDVDPLPDLEEFVYHY